MRHNYEREKQDTEMCHMILFVKYKTVIVPANLYMYIIKCISLQICVFDYG